MFCSDPVIRVYEGSVFGHTASDSVLDFVSDYVIRCKGCGRSTRAEGFAICAIGDWNRGDTPCDCSGIGDL